jgi:hypothetical protein
MEYCQVVTVEELMAKSYCRRSVEEDSDILLKKEALGSGVFCFLSLPYENL